MNIKIKDLWPGLVSLLVILVGLAALGRGNFAYVCLSMGLYGLFLLSLLRFLTDSAKRGVKRRDLIVLFSQALLAVAACFSDLSLVALIWSYCLILIACSISILFCRDKIPLVKAANAALALSLIISTFGIWLLPWSRLLLAENLSNVNHVKLLLPEVHRPLRGKYRASFEEFQHACNGLAVRAFVINSFAVGSYLFVATQDNKVIRVQRVTFI